MSSAFVADPNNKIVLSVRGWSKTELEKILGDFLRSYQLPVSPTISIKVISSDNFSIAFPRDIEPSTLFFLVNYLAYPRDFDLTHRSIGILCHVVITPAFGAPNAALIGQQAEIYVPAHDTEYDLVFAQTEAGKAYKIPFTTLIWEPVNDPRVPETIKGL